MGFFLKWLYFSQVTILLEIHPFDRGTSGGFTMVFNLVFEYCNVYHWSNSSCATFIEKIRFKFTLILEVRSVKSPKKTHQKSQKATPTEAHACVWSPKTPPFPPWSLVISGVWQPEAFSRSFTFISPSWMSRVIVLYYVWYWGWGLREAPTDPGPVDGGKKLGGFDARGLKMVRITMAIETIREGTLWKLCVWNF